MIWLLKAIKELGESDGMSRVIESWFMWPSWRIQEDNSHSLAVHTCAIAKSVHQLLSEVMNNCNRNFLSLTAGLLKICWLKKKWLRKIYWTIFINVLANFLVRRWCARCRLQYQRMVKYFDLCSLPVTLGKGQCTRLAMPSKPLSVKYVEYYLNSRRTRSSVRHEMLAFLGIFPWTSVLSTCGSRICVN